MEIGNISLEWLPLEQMLQKGTSGQGIRIGLPAERNHNESRIVLTPLEVNVLVEQGHQVIVERNLGSRTQYSNRDFADVGATMVDSHSEAFNADVVVRVSPPDLGEIELMKTRAALISSIRGAANDEKYFRSLLNNKITAISFEHIQTVSGEFPLLDTIQEIAGNTAMMVATSLLADGIDGQGKSLSGFAGIPPAEVLVLGSNAAAISAVSTAIGMGANVKVLDRNVLELYNLRKKISPLLYTGILNYETLPQMLATADIVICSLHFSEGRPDFFIVKELLKKMKKGAIIIDLTIDCGGSFETSRPTTLANPIFKEDHVTHYCVPNITALVPNTTSMAFSNFLAPVLQRIGYEGIDNVLLKDSSLLNSVYTYKGYATNSHFSQMHNLQYKEIDLLMAIFNK